MEIYQAEFSTLILNDYIKNVRRTIWYWRINYADLQNQKIDEHLYTASTCSLIDLTIIMHDEL